jgi:hypothetical protein
MKCENNKCEVDHEGLFGSGRFCCRSCANAFSTQKNSASRNSKISKALSGRPTGLKTYNWTDEQRAKAATRNKELANNRFKNSSWEQLPKSRRREKILEEQNKLCAVCNCSQIWNSKKLVFQLDHISGNRKDESRNNLRLICPNCHSQTNTWGSKNASEDGKIRMKIGQSNGGRATAKRILDKSTETDAIL